MVAPAIGFPIPLLVGDVSWLGGSATVCEEDPAVCLPTSPPGEGDVNPVPPPGNDEINAFAKTLPEGEEGQLTITKAASLTRWFGGKALMGGRFWTTANIGSSGEAKTVLGLYEGNTAEFVARADFPAGSSFLVRGLASRATQVYIEYPLLLARRIIVKMVEP